MGGLVRGKRPGLSSYVSLLNEITSPSHPFFLLSSSSGLRIGSSAPSLLLYSPPLRVFPGLSVRLTFTMSTDAPPSHPDPSPAAEMSQPNTPYHPVGVGDGLQDDRPSSYRDNPSPPAPDHFQVEDPPFNAGSIHEDDIARPRFIGHAVDIGTRGSFASSFGVPSRLDDDPSSSVYALNPLGQNRDSAVGYASVPYQEDPHDSDFAASNTSPSGRGRYLEEKRGTYAAPNKSKRKIIIGAIAIGVIIAAIAIVVALYFTVIKKGAKTSSGTGSSDGGGNNNNGNNNGNTPSSNLVKSGGDGSTITFEDGTTMTYSNKFGGTWYWDPESPFTNNAQAQSWTPPLNQSFKWGEDRIFGSVPHHSRQSSALTLPCL